MPKQTVAILCGGKSSEHKISLLSAHNIISALPKKYRLVVIGINKNGAFTIFSKPPYFEYPTNPKRIRLAHSGQPVTLALDSSKHIGTHHVDVVFPVLHGAFGEDGTVQGFCEIVNIPYVGAGVLGSAIGMDKEITKRLLKEDGILVAPFKCIRKKDRKLISYTKLARQFGTPFFVKPATSGSSIGVHKVRSQLELLSALDDAFSHSDNILIEKMMDGREIEVAVLGNDHPVVSKPGEIIPHHDFYSYEAKYLDNDGAELIAPAKLTNKQTRIIQKTALQAYMSLASKGMARVDGFLLKNGKFYINEINTIPGFTNISMYPKLWEISGIPYAQLLDRLIKLALNPQS